MPTIYLSPSTQEFNNYLTGGTEEQYMNLLADYMEPYLLSSAVNFVRNTPDMTAATSIIQSNEGNYDLHLALHSNASPEYLSGQLQGTDVYYYPRSEKGREAAETIAANIKTIYPNPELVNTIPTTSIGEVRRTNAPAVLIEVAYHDNAEDEAWIKNNLETIAVNIVQSLTQYFGIPFVSPIGVTEGTVITQGGNLNIRSYPSFDSYVIASVPNGSPITVLGKYEDWYTVRYNNSLGYAYSGYISIL
ncbi:MAG: N-acetylmuramoyl-L-alanine amidase [Clostridiales bacterium]|nr:N-acetylmuramoyl-L-alanine amidase [Clostridiales bacterium]